MYGKKTSMKLYKEFFFEAAHYLRSAPDGHPNSRIHGHSFRVRVTLEGKPDPETGLLMDLGIVYQTVKEIREKLDHRFLYDIPGLEYATLENLTRWIWKEAKQSLPLLSEITVSRDSCMEGCVYQGE